MTSIETVSTWLAHGGVQGVYRHASATTGAPMTFAVYVPPHAPKERLPVLFYLSGLTCTHANAMEKGEYRKAAAERGLIVVLPDTSPRGPEVPDHESYDFGQGASFYLDATEEPWSTNFRMDSYLTSELPHLLATHFPVDLRRQGITGHSMGGHGALTLALRHPGRFESVSALAPICAPTQVPWGQKALEGYLGPEGPAWRAADSVCLIEDGHRISELLVDQGSADNFLESQLRPHTLERACADAGIPLTLHSREGYDHSYYFVSTFLGAHVHWHADRLTTRGYRLGA